MAIDSGISRLQWALALSVSSACLATGAVAQDTATAETGLEEIVVTAQRREERLQDVPIAISALGADELAKRSVVDVAGLRGAVPGLTISYSAGINASNLVAIRGVSGLPSPIGTSQATAIYLDGVYLSRPNAAFFSLDDVERVEVLRGPQGTLYGRNATAGAINIITRTPGDTPAGGVDLSYGDFNSIGARGSLSGPLTEILSAGISASYDSRDGYFDNTVTGEDIGERESYTVRSSIRLAPTDSFSALLSGDYSSVDRQEVFRNVYAAGVYVGTGDPNKVSIDALSASMTESTTDSKGAALTLSYSINDSLDLISITAYREVEAFDGYDLDGSAAPAIFSRSLNTSDTFNQELRAVFSADRLNVTGGINYFTEDATYGLGPLAAPSPFYSLTAPFDSSDLTAYAAFSQVEYEVISGVTLVAGLRFNNEERDFVVDYSRAAVPGPRTTGQVEDDVLIPSGGVNWKISPDILLYVKASSGYQAPGFNAQPGATAGLPNTFDAETLTAYEAGIKSQLLDRRLTVNAATFWYDYTDLQVRNTVGLGLTSISNAASATVKGVELGVSTLLADSLTLSAQATYVDAKYDEFCETISGGSPRSNDPLCANPLQADRSDNRLNLAPEWSGAVNLDYRIPIAAAGELAFNVGYSWESNSYFTAPNESILSTGGWERVDSRVAFELDSGLTVYVYGKNLTDDRYVGFALRGNAVLAPAVISDPRTYGAGVRYRF
jgi:iron complex outermembrane recepter protein